METSLIKEFKIIITPDAEADLNELRKNPKRYRIVEDEPWHSRGVRRMNAKNFAVFYYVYEEYAEVYVQNVIYQKRDLPKLLSERYSDLGELY